MKTCVIQPYYSFEAKDLDYCYNEMIKLIDQCDDSMDLIVLPEYCDVPAAQESKAGFHASVARYNASIMEKAKETARRCHAIVFVNAASQDENGKWRNTTHAIDREGNVVGQYLKAHPAPSEVKTEAQGGNELEVGYSYRPFDPYVVEIEAPSLCPSRTPAASPPAITVSSRWTRPWQRPTPWAIRSPATPLASAPLSASPRPFSGWIHRAFTVWSTASFSTANVLSATKAAASPW